MKLYKALTFLLSFIPLALYAQNADQRINELLGSGDLFALNREYSEIKDSTSNLEESNILLGTYGSTEKKELLSMPEVSFKVGGKGTVIHDVLIHTTPDGNQHSGTVGLELLRKFSKVNINLQNMTLTVK